MISSIASYRLLASFALVAMISANGASAEAFWASFGSYGSGGSYGSVGSYGSGGSYGRVFRGSVGSAGSVGSYGSGGSHGAVSTASWGSGGSYGSTGGCILSRIRARRLARASFGSTGSVGSTGSTGSTGSYGSHGYSSTGSTGSTGSHGSYGGSVIYDTYEAPAPAVPTLVEPQASVQTESGLLIVAVPAEAKVFVNDRATSSTGTVRQYVSNGLKVGSKYRYRVRVEYTVAGKEVVEHSEVVLTGGATESLAFGTTTETPVVAEKTETKLTLNVPADATVTLAGSQTSQTGESRDYVTSGLAAGQAWEGYVVRVEYAGLIEERTITLHGGESQQLSFDFAGDAALQVASID